MPVTEFEIIRRYFQRQQTPRADVIAGIGDDAALLQVPDGDTLVVCMDTLVEGVHFSPSAPAAAIGHKSLAVNLSDLAAMGASPRWATLSVTLPGADPQWLEQFSQGFLRLADTHTVQLVGGDTTRGPLSITVQAHGTVPRGRALLRSGAQAGDRVYVTGTLGDAGLALRAAGQGDAALQRRLDYPQPCIAAGLLLRDYASAAIDVSDGLLVDLGHLLEGAGLGATLEIEVLPRSVAFIAYFKQSGVDHPEWFYQLPLMAGDDYELCFSVPPQDCAAMEQALAAAAIAVTAIGTIEAQSGVRCLDAQGDAYPVAETGYRHFQD